MNSRPSPTDVVSAEGIDMATDKIVLICLATAIGLIAFPLAYGFEEDWESAATGTYVPASEDQLPRLISADEGDWIVADTVTEFPECGVTPHRAEILDRAGGHLLRLTSGDSNSGCADNVWVVLFEVPLLGLNTGFSVSISSDSIISFDEAGVLSDPQKGSPTCLVLPCGDTTSLEVEDNRGNIVAYVFQRAPDAVPNLLHDFYREIFLNTEGGVFTRNLFDDLKTVPAFNPVGASIRSISFNVNEHGWAELGNICIGDSSCGMPVETVGGDDVAIDFGAIGLWARINGTSWLKLSNSSPDQLAVADMDGNGQDDVVADFGSTLGGIFVKRDQAACEKLHNMSPDSMAISNLDNQ